MCCNCNHFTCILIHNSSILCAKFIILFFKLCMCAFFSLCCMINCWTHNEHYYTKKLALHISYHQSKKTCTFWTRWLLLKMYLKITEVVAFLYWVEIWDTTQSVSDKLNQKRWKQQHRVRWNHYLRHSSGKNGLFICQLWL